MGLEFSFHTLTELEERGDPRCNLPPECWRLIRANPNHDPGLPVLARAVHDGTVVAGAALIHQPLQWRDRTVPCVWDYSVYSEPHARSTGAGGLLMRSIVREMDRRGVVLAAYGSNPAANDLYRALRMPHLGRVPRYVLPLRANPVTRLYLKRRWLAAIAALPINAVLRVRNRLRRRCLRAAAARHPLHRHGRFTPECLPPVEDARPRVARPAPFLNCKLDYARADAMAAVDAWTVEGRGGRTGAYFVTRIARHPVVGKRRFRDVKMCRVLDLVAEADGPVLEAAFFH